MKKDEILAAIKNLLADPRVLPADKSALREIVALLKRSAATVDAKTRAEGWIRSASQRAGIVFF